MMLSDSQKRASNIVMVITAINVLVASGFSIVGLINPKLMLPSNAILTDASFIFAMYAAARTLPLAIITLVVIFKRSTSSLLILGLLAGCIQFVDTFVGLYQHDIGKSVGPLILAILQFYSLYILNKSIQKNT